MPRIVTQRNAEEDLLEIWQYTLNAWGECQADAYLDDLHTAVHLLAEQPLICRERTEFDPPVRIHHHAHHLIVYQAIDDGINIIRILHQNMALERLLE